MMIRSASKRISNRFLDLQVDDVELVRLLGSGNSGNVWLAWVYDRELGTRSIYAAKKIRHENEFRADPGRGSTELESLKNELKIYVRLQYHPNFPKLIGVVQDMRHFTIITEYVEGGDLRSFLRQKANQKGMFIHQPVSDTDYNECTTFKRNESQALWQQRFDKPRAVGSVTTSVLVYISLQIALALKYLVVDLKILHRDTAARNVLVTGDFLVKITDFGLARDANYDQESRRDLPFTALALETLQTHKCTAQSEVWQFGVLLFEIFSLGTVQPYGDLLANATTQRSAKKLLGFLEHGGRLSPPQNMPGPIKRLMAKCFLEKPRDRPTFDNIATTLHDLLRFMAPELALNIDSAMQHIAEGLLNDDHGASVDIAFSSNQSVVKFSPDTNDRPDDLRPLLSTPTGSDGSNYERNNRRRFSASVASPRQNSTDISLPSKKSPSPFHSNTAPQSFLSKLTENCSAIRVIMPIALLLLICAVCLAVYELFINKNPIFIFKNPIFNFQQESKELNLINPMNPMNSTDCLAIHEADRNAKSGFYNISFGSSEPFRVYCDMKTDGGGWTVFQRRSSNSGDIFYNQSWEDYKIGFGISDKMDNFWLGLDHIHQLSTMAAEVELRIELNGSRCTVKASDQNQIHCDTKMVDQEWFGVWKKFWVDNETLNYALHVSEPGAGSLNSYAEHDSLMKTNNNQSFTTIDRDNDESQENCAKIRMQGAWWYKNCICKSCNSPRIGVLEIALNGKYHESFDYGKQRPHGIIWEDEGKDRTHDALYRIVPIRTEMKLRRVVQNNDAFV